MWVATDPGQCLTLTQRAMCCSYDIVVTEWNYVCTFISHRVVNTFHLGYEKYQLIRATDEIVI